MSYAAAEPAAEILQSASVLAAQLQTDDDDAYAHTYKLLAEHGVDTAFNGDAPALAVIGQALLESATRSETGALAQAPARSFLRLLGIEDGLSGEIVLRISHRAFEPPVFHLRNINSIQTLCGKTIDFDAWPRRWRVGHPGDFAAGGELGAACKSCSRIGKLCPAAAPERLLSADDVEAIRTAAVSATANVIAAGAPGNAKSDLTTAIRAAQERELSRIVAERLYARSDYADWLERRLPYYLRKTLADHHGSWEQVPLPPLAVLSAAFAAAEHRQFNASSLYRDGGAAVFYLAEQLLPQLVARCWPNLIEQFEQEAKNAAPQQGTMTTTSLISNTRKVLATL